MFEFFFLFFFEVDAFFSVNSCLDWFRERWQAWKSDPIVAFSCLKTRFQIHLRKFVCCEMLILENAAEYLFALFDYNK